jgi:hypothetical protein
MAGCAVSYWARTPGDIAIISWSWSLRSPETSTADRVKHAFDFDILRKFSISDAPDLFADLFFQQRRNEFAGFRILEERHPT